MRRQEKEGKREWGQCHGGFQFKPGLQLRIFLKFPLGQGEDNHINQAPVSAESTLVISELAAIDDGDHA